MLSVNVTRFCGWQEGKTSQNTPVSKYQGVLQVCLVPFYSMTKTDQVSKKLKRTSVEEYHEKCGTEVKRAQCVRTTCILILQELLKL